MKILQKSAAILSAAALLCFTGCSVLQTAAENTGSAAAESASGTEETQTRTRQKAPEGSTGREEASQTQAEAPVTVPQDQTLTETPPQMTADAGETVTAAYTAPSGKLSSAVEFTERDLLQTPDLTDAKYYTAADNASLTITRAGVYVLTGTADNCTVKVDAPKDAGVQLVLNNVSVTNANTPVIYVISADRVYITTVSGSSNTLEVTGTFASDGETKTDAVIFSKADLTFNGCGTLTVASSNNGISGKDGIRFTGGTYEITSVKDAVEANDAIAVCGGTFTVRTSKDGFHAENDEDDTLGWIWIGDGSIAVDASSDGIQATTVLEIDGGSVTVKGSEGLEATYVQINGGNITVTAADDGVNASRKSGSIPTPTVEFTGGNTRITVGQGDTDAIDANGNIIVSGGVIDVTSTVSSFDYDGVATYTGGTIIINGQTVDSIPQSMMPGGPGGQGGQGGPGGRR